MSKGDKHKVNIREKYINKYREMKKEMYSAVNEKLLYRPKNSKKKKSSYI